MNHHWQRHASGHWDILTTTGDGCGSHAVSTRQTERHGSPAFLWVAGKVSGYADSIELAEEWVETIAETGMTREHVARFAADRAEARRMQRQPA